jgi:hypothetical protein
MFRVSHRGEGIDDAATIQSLGAGGKDDQHETEAVRLRPDAIQRRI